jgi:hypothetical protein
LVNVFIVGQQEKMKDLEPETKPCEWLWFGATLLVMTLMGLAVGPAIGPFRAR